jgi:SAM-dependent methyltransferase
MSAPELLYSNEGNGELLALVPSETQSVLDVGCGAGDNARLLTARGCVVDGITYSAAEMDVARWQMRDCFVGDLEDGLPADALQRRYDCVFFSHVLEHLRHPEALVAQAQSVLTECGVVLIAVPNVLNWRQRLDFLRGHFDYGDTGILDRTHLRFYTYASAPQLLAEATGLELELRAAPGAIPLWFLRRHILPDGWRARLDQLGCSLAPGLFGRQLLLRARRRPDAGSRPEPKVRAGTFAEARA